MSKKKKRDQAYLSRRTVLKGLGATTAVATASQVAPTPAQAQEDEYDGPAMRSPKTKTTQRQAPQSTPSLAVIALNRMGFGPRPGDVASFNALGNNDNARLQAYVDQQLNPDSIDDSAFEAMVAAEGFATIDKSLNDLWVDHYLNYVNSRPPEYTNSTWSWRNISIDDAERLTFDRALHSKRQLQEVLADFWHNHFNVYGHDFTIRTIFMHYDREVIRKNMLGNFRQMLEDVAKSTAMLYYLDNRSNSGGTPNENYARELFELHTMGAENYLGTLPQASVPTDSNGLPIAYVDDDVYGATTCFTGWQVDTSTGEFFYDSSDHFPNQKIVFGTVIPANQAPLKDGQDVLDMLASHPGTARYVCRKLCRRLISDNPSESTVQAAADVFLAQKDAADQLKQVVRVILLSDEFKTTWGEKIKRPFEAIVSGLRGIGSDYWISRYPFSNSESDLHGSFFSSYDDIGQCLFNWQAPTGYPDTRDDWNGTVSLLQRWRMFNWMFDWWDGSQFVIDVVAMTPTTNPTANALVDYWVNRILNRSMDAADREQIVDFMAQGRNPDFDLPLETDVDTQDRVQMMVSLILNSPDFQWR
ncbi:MAG: DUF1800 family protein [Chloroflexota bacterium]